MRFIFYFQLFLLYFWIIFLGAFEVLLSIKSWSFLLSSICLLPLTTAASHVSLDLDQIFCSFIWCDLSNLWWLHPSIFHSSLLLSVSFLSPQLQVRFYQIWTKSSVRLYGVIFKSLVATSQSGWTYYQVVLNSMHCGARTFLGEQMI